MPDSKTILVTGASSGIGAAITARLLQEGHRVLGTGRTGGQKNAAGVELLQLDVRSNDSVKSCVDRFLDRMGRIDVLINNAGYLQSGAI
jgi:NAD(P)-dependent dehydrogenase (short-subunit alcohol dehydrogenase family)